MGFQALAKIAATRSTASAHQFNIARGDAMDQVLVLLDESGQVERVRGAGDICTLCSTRLPIYVCGQLPFRSRNGIADFVGETAKTEVIALQLDQETIAENLSFWPTVLMSASVGKCAELSQRADGTRFFGPTGHLASWLRQFSGRGHRVGLFGHVRMVAEAELYIKPLALWH